MKQTMIICALMFLTFNIKSQNLPICGNENYPSSPSEIILENMANKMIYFCGFARRHQDSVLKMLDKKWELAEIIRYDFSKKTMQDMADTTDYSNAINQEFLTLSLDKKKYVVSMYEQSTGKNKIVKKGKWNIDECTFYSMPNIIENMFKLWILELNASNFVLNYAYQGKAITIKYKSN